MIIKNSVWQLPSATFGLDSLFSVLGPSGKGGNPELVYDSVGGVIGFSLIRHGAEIGLAVLETAFIGNGFCAVSGRAELKIDIVQG